MYTILLVLIPPASVVTLPNMENWDMGQLARSLLQFRKSSIFMADKLLVKRVTTLKTLKNLNCHYQNQIWNLVQLP